MFKKLFDKIFPQKIADVVVKNINKVPTESRITNVQNDLMDKLFYFPLREICEEGVDNTKSFTFKNNRPFFTARGAFLFRKDINEEFLLDMPKFTGGKPIVTHFLNDSMRQDEKSEFLLFMGNLIEKESGFVFSELLEHSNVSVSTDDNPIDRKKLYWSFFAKICHLNICYLYNNPDLNFCLERLSRNIFTMIAIEELSDECFKKQELVLEKEEVLVKTLAYCLHPFSLNAFSDIRNAAPKTVGQRMHTVQIKLKNISRKTYVSPYQQFKSSLESSK